MKREYRGFGHVGTVCCVGSLVVLWLAVLTLDWLSIQEPILDAEEVDKLGPYQEPRPHLIRAKFGLFRICLEEVRLNFKSGGGQGQPGDMDTLTTLQLQLEGQQRKSKGGESHPTCHDLDWYNFKFLNLNLHPKPPPSPTELIGNSIQKLRLTLPFIGLSLLFTSIAFLCLIFGHFCHKNKKIIEASMLILGGLSQATALLSFVSQIGSEFEANLPFSHHESRLTTFYRYKYGYSFYLFLLSFALSELGAFFDMLAFFKKYPPAHYVISFRQDPPSGHQSPPPSSPPTRRDIHVNHPPSIPNFNSHSDYGDSSRLTMTRKGQTTEGCPDLCNSFAGGWDGYERCQDGGQLRREEVMIPPPQSYMNTQVTITTIDRSTVIPPYATLNSKRNSHSTNPNQRQMESFGTLRKENNV